MIRVELGVLQTVEILPVARAKLETKSCSIAKEQVSTIEPLCTESKLIGPVDSVDTMLLLALALEGKIVRANRIRDNMEAFFMVGSQPDLLGMT
jgi:hypothetical protein